MGNLMETVAIIVFLVATVCIFAAIVGIVIPISVFSKSRKSAFKGLFGFIGLWFIAVIAIGGSSNSDPEPVVTAGNQTEAKVLEVVVPAVPSETAMQEFKPSQEAMVAETVERIDTVAEATSALEASTALADPKRSDRKVEIQSAAASHTKKSPLHDETKQWLWIEKTKDGVRRQLKDPSSAKFGNVAFHAYRGNTPVVCGEVNSRNGFGGYTGNQRFIASGEKLVFLQSAMAAAEFSKAWNELCRG